MRVTKRYGILVLFLALVLILPWQDAVAMVQPKDTVVQVLPLDTVGAVLPLDSAPVPLPRSLGKRNAAFRDSAAVVYADSLQNNVMDSVYFRERNFFVRENFCRAQSLSNKHIKTVYAVNPKFLSVKQKNRARRVIDKVKNLLAFCEFCKVDKPFHGRIAFVAFAQGRRFFKSLFNGS